MGTKIHTYVFDLDGTLCSKETDYTEAKPFTDRIKKVNKLSKKYKIIIDTARGSETGIDWEKITKEQLEKWGVKYDILKVGQKTFGDIYVDDKAINDEEFFKLL